MTSFSTSDRDMHAEIDARIARYGWTVMSVLPGVNPDTPPFSYSIGFEESYNSPEILIMGLAPDQARGLIASIAEQLSNGEIRLPAKRTRIPGHHPGL